MLVVFFIKYFNRYTRYLYIYIFFFITIFFLESFEINIYKYGVIIALIINQTLYNNVFYELEIANPFCYFPIHNFILIFYKNCITFIMSTTTLTVMILLTYKFDYGIEYIIEIIIMAITTNLLQMIFGNYYFAIYSKESQKLSSNGLILLQIFISVLPNVIIYYSGISKALLLIFNIFIILILFGIWYSFIIHNIIFIYNKIRGNS